jgi:hypothetical protein
MKNFQNARMNMIEAVNSFFVENGPILNAYSPLATQITNFNATLAKLKAVIIAQNRSTKGITTQKNEQAKTLKQILLTTANTAHAWAQTIKNKDLITTFHITTRSLNRLTQNQLIATANNISQHLSQNLTSLTPYEITPTLINNIQSNINTFTTLIATPQNAKSIRKNATTNLAKLLTKITSNLKLIDNLIFGKYATTNPTLFTTYKNIRKINFTSIRHTGIQLTIIDNQSQQPVTQATIHLPKPNRTAITTINGTAQIIKFRFGNHQCIITHPQYNTLTLILPITQGKILSQTINLTQRQIQSPA